MPPFLDVLTIFLVALTLSPFVFARIIERKRCKELLQTFGGKISLLGTLSFNFEGNAYAVSRVGVAGAYGRGGSYPVLWTYVKPTEKIILGHPLSKKFSNASFLVLPKNETVRVGPREILVGSKDDRRIEAVKVAATDERFIHACECLFDRDYCCITVRSQIHFLGGRPKQKNVLEYTALSNDIYRDPELLKMCLRSVAECARALNLQFE